MMLTLVFIFSNGYTHIEMYILNHAHRFLLHPYPRGINLIQSVSQDQFDFVCIDY
jgi:hypothetical protein